MIAERNHDKGRAVAAEIGGEALAIHTDVADPASIDTMVAAVEQRFRRIDILVNNAGIFSTLEMRPFEQIPLAEWDDVLRVNVTGPFLCSRAVLPAMRRAGWGGSSTWRRAPSPQYGPTTALHHLEGRAGRHERSMARELGAEGITVNSILPGATFTEIERKAVTPEQKARIVAQPASTAGSAGGSGRTVLFLLGGLGVHPNQALTVDGGTHPWSPVGSVNQTERKLLHR